VLVVHPQIMFASANNMHLQIMFASACHKNGESASSVHASSVYMSCRAHGMLTSVQYRYRLSVTCLLDSEVPA